MLRLAVSSGPTYDRPGQPSGPLRVRGLTGEADDQAWFSSLAGSRLLLRVGAEPRGRHMAFRFERLLLIARRSNVGSPPNMVVLFFARMSRYCGVPEITPTCALFATGPGPRRPSAGPGLRCHPTRPGLDVRDIRGNRGTLRDEPFRGCLGLFTKISWIDGRRMIGMQKAFCSFDPIIRHTKHVFVLRSLMMNTHLFRPQHHQSKFSGRIVHV